MKGNEVIFFSFFEMSLSLVGKYDLTTEMRKRRKEKKLFFPSSPLISPFPILRSRQKPKKCPFPKKEIKLKREGI